MHIAFSEIVDEIVRSNWGREFKSVEDASKAVVQDLPRLTAFASVSLLQRLNKISKSVGDDEAYSRQKSLELCEDSGTYPNSSVGDRLFFGDVYDGIDEYIIIAKDDEHHCMVVVANHFNLMYPPGVFIAGDDLNTSLAAAVANSGKSNLEYYESRVALAKDAIQAAKSDEDLSRFFDGINE